MTTNATPNPYATPSEATLFMAFELSENTWKLGFTTGPGQKPRERSVPARNQERIVKEIAQAKRRLGLPETAPVVSCYAAGRDGFWLHRFLQAHGMTNHVVDSSAIEVSRRRRRAKSDGVDVRKLLRMLIRYVHGERQVWQVVQVPSVEAEDQRHLHRYPFSIGPDNRSQVDQQAVSDETLWEAAQLCPTSAIIIEDAETGERLFP